MSAAEPTAASDRGHDEAEAAVEQALVRARTAARPLALLLLDAREVEAIDRAFGHAAGAHALTQLRARLQAVAPATSTLLRFARERFVLIAEQLHDVAAAVALAEALVAAAGAPLTVEDIELRLDATVGVALAERGEGDAAALLRDAAAAAWRAHGTTARWQLADAAARERELRRLRIEHELSGALARGELALYFQPIVSLRRGTLLGIEALVRWQHPTRGLVGPAQFLPIAEDCGLIVQIGDWVLAEVCRQVGQWSALEPERPLPAVSLNVSGRELREETFVARFTDALVDSGIPPHAIVLEIADPGAVPERAAENALGALRELGVTIVLDQFGSSRSSLTHLAQLPVDGLKLDRALLAPTAGAGLSGTAAGKAPIVEAIVWLAHALGLSITVPGIETEQQLEIVRGLDVDAAQGHLIARPAPARSLLDLRELERDVSALGRRAVAAEVSDELLSLSAVASALGVSPSTVRRLADQGVLAGTRTEGGHRRFRRADVQRLARERRHQPSLRPWELPTRPLPVSAALLEHDGGVLLERTARTLYDAHRPGWFAAPLGLARGRAWLDTTSTLLAVGGVRDAVGATAAYADAALLGGASAAEAVRFLGQFTTVATHELIRGRGSADEARALQRLMNAATEAFLDQAVP